ncbi:hypothetical protein B566_EDAN003142 [Ephemera danica]|nr:hypothetical protein B566_EDAN003142 [Ephemera danica]
MVQFGTFLASSLSVEEYIGRLPTVNSMLAKFHIHADVAFFLARPMFTHAINNKCEALRRADPSGKNMTTEQKHEKYIEACNIVLGPIVESVRPLHAPKIWEDISPQFLVTFWSLTTYDLFVPTKSYQNEISKLKQMAAQAMENKDGATGKGKKEQEKLTQLMEKLQDECKKQGEHVEKVMARLKKEKDSWFLSRSAKSAKNETITQFLQLCLFPRCIFTAPDAVYCAKFVQTIHSLKTANFSTLLCYDRLFCDITYTVTSCTENEANRYGRFLCAMLDTVMRWHRTKETFDNECANFPGFVTKFKVSNHFSDANDHVGYENYRHVCHKWHYKITKALVVCLDSKDYVQIRNSLIILIKILPHFPVLSKLLHIIERKVEKVREEEKDKRQDLFILATSYCGQLKAKSSKIIPEKDFHQISEKLMGGRPGEASTVKQETTSQLTHNQTSSATSEVNGDSKGMDPPSDRRGATSETGNKSSSASKRETISVSKEREDQSPPVAEKWERGSREERHEEVRYYEQALRSTQYRGSSAGRQDLEAEHSSNSSPSSSMQRLSQEPPDSDRDPKRRKLEGSSKRQEDGKAEEKKERTAKSKPRSTDEERELRKERKLGRKRVGHISDT